ncbi:MAG TPA: hypothetical protein VGK67_33930 [Myxococcales bacterium]|jgi:hypothetical protein
MSEPAPTPAAVQQPPPAFPSLGWAFIGIAAALAAAALVLSRVSESTWALLTAAGCAAVGFGLVRHAYRLAREAHDRVPLMACGLLLGFLAIPLFGAVGLGVLYLLTPR